MLLQSSRFIANQVPLVIERLEQALENRPPIRVGERNRGAVRALQHALADLDNPDFDPGVSDGLFGARTRQAVMAFQKAFGLVPDGIVGAQTLATLDKLYADEVAGKVKGLSLHFGLNAVDPEHYGGWDGKLAGCEHDARDMENIASGLGYETRRFLTNDATSAVLMTELERAAKQLTGGDILWLTFSGHGSQVPNTNGDDESDGLDETWCMFDRQVIDDELFAAFSRFSKGVRILCISDSCHSGTVTRTTEFRALSSAATSSLATLLAPSGFRAMPSDSAHRVYEIHRATYDNLQNSLPASDRVDLAASLVLLSACQDHQLAGDMATNGVFTAHLKAVWNSGGFQGNLRRLHEVLRSRMPASQQPGLLPLGSGADAFSSQRPFSI